MSLFMMHLGTSGTTVSPYLTVGADCVLYHAYKIGGDATDHSSYGNNGTVFGAVFGENGLSFDGIDDYVALGDPVSLRVFETGIYTFEIWVQGADQGGGSADIQVFNEGNVTGSFDPTIFIAGGTKTYGVLRPGVDRYCAPDNQMEFNTWIHIVIVRSGPLVNGPDFYTNGGLVSAASGKYDVSAGGDKEFGRRAPGYNHLQGIIGEARIYNTALSDSGILANFNATKGIYGL